MTFLQSTSSNTNDRESQEQFILSFTRLVSNFKRNVNRDGGREK